MTILPRPADSAAPGIVIRTGAPVRRPARFWAYLWTADDDDARPHWHQQVPSERTA